MQNLKRLMAKLDQRTAQAMRDADVVGVVGFTAWYSLFVHENIEMKWKGRPRRSGKGVYWGPHGQAKFLEQPARTLAADGTLGSIIVQVYRAGKGMAMAILTACLRLQRESQLLVPVETGNLRASAFSRLETK